MAAAYNLNGLHTAGYRGEGQTVALFELDTFVMSDLTAYAACYGGSHTSIQTIIANTPVSTDSGLIEVELDAELVLSAAPNLSQLRIYEASNDGTDTGNNAEWAALSNDAPPVVSTSWGLCEADMIANDPNEFNTENGFFMTMAAQGETIVAASGDYGSSDCYPQNTNLSRFS